MKKIKNFFIVIILLQVICIGSVSANDIIFVDITNNYQWAENDIYYFVEQGVIQGVGDNKFAPGEKVTREQFAKMMVLGFKATLKSPDENTFLDVKRTNWSYDYIETCKDFLTGYTNPFGGKPTFRPNEAATREDMAVALVKLMGYSENDVQDEYYLNRNFEDYNIVSPGLKKYMTIAAEKGIMQGDKGKLRPSDNINRAEAVALLSRATKQAVSSITGDLSLECEYEKGDKEGNYTIFVESNENVEFTIDGKKVNSIYSDMLKTYSGAMIYQFKEEGEHIFIIKATKGTKEVIKELKIKYEIGAPELKITYCPETSEVEEVTIKGTVSDKNDSKPKVYINGEPISVSYYYKEWSKSLKLKEGSNLITIKAVNKSGKETVINKTITFGVGAPELKVTYCPETSEVEIVTIKGTVSDKNDSEPKVYINGEPISVSYYYKEWSKSLKLKEGLNSITVKAINKNGKETIMNKTITFGIGAPELKITYCPETSEVEEVTIKGTVSDKNDSEPKIYINGESIGINSFKEWSKSLKLKEGSNPITIKAVNKNGKETVMNKTITFGVGTPELRVTDCPETSAIEEVTIKGTVSDKNDSEPKVYINGEQINVSHYYKGEWSKQITLKEGVNPIEIKAVNKNGKETVEDRTITFTRPSPVITITKYPSETDKNTAIIYGYITYAGKDLTVTINGQVVEYDRDKVFNITVDLVEGENSFEIIAINKYGKEDSCNITIKYIVNKSIEEPTEP